MQRRGNIRPKKQIHHEASSDRRLASGFKSDQFLKSNNRRRITDPKLLNKVKNILDSTNGNSLETTSKKKEKAMERIDPKTGKRWYDRTLADWNPSHFRLFVGNIGEDVTEKLLVETFIKYGSLSKVKIPRVYRQGEEVNKGYAFISFANPDDYLRCYKEMNGKYVGNKPIVLQRAKTELGEVVTGHRKGNKEIFVKGKKHKNHRGHKKDKKKLLV